jgi:hypothetical protein
MVNHANAPSWSEKLANRLKASPQKAAVLCGLGLVLVVLWARMLMGGHIPSGAAAATATGLPIIAPQNDLNVPTHPTDHANVLLQWAREQIVPMRRNLFAIPFDYYPSDQSHAADATEGTGFWNLLAKSMSVEADQQVQRQALIQGLADSARSLQLQSTMVGATPSAMVNGEMVREGSFVADFRVLKIEARKIIVERQGIRLEILMR